MGFETELGEKSGVGGRVPWVLNVPADFGDHSELLLHEGVADHDVVDQVFVVGASLVSGAPSAGCDLELAVLDQLLELVFGRLILTRVPHLEVLDLSEGESARGVFGKLLGDGSENSADRGVVDHLLRAGIVLVDGFQKAYIGARKWNHVHRDRPICLIRSMSQIKPFTVSRIP